MQEKHPVKQLFGFSWQAFYFGCFLIDLENSLKGTPWILKYTVGCCPLKARLVSTQEMYQAWFKGSS